MSLIAGFEPGAIVRDASVNVRASSYLSRANSARPLSYIVSWFFASRTMILSHISIASANLSDFIRVFFLFTSTLRLSGWSSIALSNDSIAFSKSFISSWTTPSSFHRIALDGSSLTAAEKHLSASLLSPSLCCILPMLSSMYASSGSILSALLRASIASSGLPSKLSAAPIPIQRSLSLESMFMPAWSVRMASPYLFSRDSAFPLRLMMSVSFGSCASILS